MTVDFAVTGTGADPATAEDFAAGALPQGTLDFAPGATVVPLTVEIAGDTDVEPDQRFTVALSDPQGNPVGASTGGSRVGIIRNDDIPLVANTPPVARDDIAATPEDTDVTIPVLANDSDAESDPLQIVAIGNRPDLGGPPGFGTVTQSGDTLIYDPDPGFRGTDAFSYEISDGNGGTAAARVEVVVGDPAPATAPEGNLRGTAGDDALLIFGGANYLGGEGDDIYLISPGVAARETSVINDNDADVVQLTEGLAILSSAVTANAVQLTLVNGAVVQILNAASFSFEIGANVTTGDSGLIQDYETFAAATLGAPVPASGASVGGLTVIGDGGVTAFGAEADGIEFDALL